MDNSLFCFLTFALIHTLNSLTFAGAKNNINGFTVDLIHRDSKTSPFYNNSAAAAGEIFRNTALRSFSQNNIDHFHQSSGQLFLQSGVMPIYGDYLMKISLGTPPVESYAIMDTGSDLVWIQCSPCPKCYTQDRPIFDPTKSSTYTELNCSACPSDYSCGTRSKKCEYNVRYLDESFTSGVLATDTITFDGQPGASFQNFKFGCGHKNQGVFNRKGSGLVGLGPGSLSLTSQLRDATLQTFSYCLVPGNGNSKLKFGKQAFLPGEISRNAIVSTPILSGSSSMYYLNLEGVSIGKTKITNNESDQRNGNIIIDSGTMLTKLESGFYDEIEAAVKRVAGLEPVPDPRKDFKLCYKTFPKIQNLVFHFTRADVTLKKLNMFQEVKRSLVCLMIVPAESSLKIFGNVAQINFKVEYDLPNRLVSFAPADCSRF